MRIERMINYIILVGIIIMLIFALANGQDEEVIPGKTEVQEVVKPAEEIVTRLDVTIIDGVNDKLIKLNNCKVFITGKLQIVNDSFNYTKTFTEGDRYNMTISIRPKE